MISLDNSLVTPSDSTFVLDSQLSSSPHITVLTRRLVILGRLEAGLPLTLAIQPRFQLHDLFQPPRVLPHHLTARLPFLASWSCRIKHQKSTMSPITHVLWSSTWPQNCSLDPPVPKEQGRHGRSHFPWLSNQLPLASFQVKTKVLPLHQALKCTLLIGWRDYFPCCTNRHNRVLTLGPDRVSSHQLGDVRKISECCSCFSL